jgi:hypothetical protein
MILKPQSLAHKPKGPRNMLRNLFAKLIAQPGAYGVLVTLYFFLGCFRTIVGESGHPAVGIALVLF